MVRWEENQAIKEKCYKTGQKLSVYQKSAEMSPCEIRSLLDYDRVNELSRAALRVKDDCD